MFTLIINLDLQYIGQYSKSMSEKFAKFFCVAVIILWVVSLWFVYGK
jgi:hypothetical protein